MPKGKFPMKQVGMVPAKGGMMATKVVMPVATMLRKPAMRPEMMPTPLTGGKRKVGKDG